MYQLEPVLGTTSTSYFYQTCPDSAIPDGIVKKCRQIFVGKDIGCARNKKSNAQFNLFETPTTSSEEMTNSNRKSKKYPIAKIPKNETFQSSPNHQLSAQIRVLPPPSYADYTNYRDNIEEIKKQQEFTQFGVPAPSDLIRNGPIWINSGPSIESHQTKIINYSKLWRTSNDDSPNLKKRHVVTRFNRSLNDQQPLTIRVNSTINKKDEKIVESISNQTENDGWSCRTDWKYFQSSPRISDITRIRKNEKNIQKEKILTNNHQMGINMNGNRSNIDNTSLGSSRRTSDDRGSIASDSSQIMSMHEQIVRYTVNTTNPPSSSYSNRQNLEDEIMSERDTALVVRLERELTEAQQCNHRLNQQLKTLANSSNSLIKSELTNTKKQLKDQVNEANQLKKQLAKTESERSMWMSKQPNDVSTLLAEKQELRKQLDREQSEKQELFMQINSMIAQLADSGDEEEIKRLKNEVSTLKRELEAERISSLAESSRLQSELKRTKTEIEGFLNDEDKEKEKMEEEIENLQRQLDIKSESLKSLMLAKSDTSKIDKLVEENQQLKLESDELRKKLSISTTEIVEKQSEIMRLKDVNSINEVTNSKIEELHNKMKHMETLLKEEEAQKEKLKLQTNELKAALSLSEESLSKLKTVLSQFEQDAINLKEENTQLKLNNSASNEATLDQLNSLNQKIKNEKEKNEILEATLSEKDSKIDKIKVEILSAKSQAQQAESDLKLMEIRAQNAERKEQQLEAQLRAQGDSNEQLELLRNELEKSEERYQLAQNRMQKLESQLKEKESEFKQRSDSIESAIDQKNRLIEQIETLKSEKENLTTQNNQTINSLKQELNQLKIEFENQEKTVEKLNDTIENLNSEKKKLETKASVADEITTLMSSLESVRQENNEYEEEIGKMVNEMRQLREELYSTQDECQQWKEKAENESNLHMKRIELLKTSEENQTAQLEKKNKDLEELIETIQNEKEELRRNYLNEISTLNETLTESNIKNERIINELNEKIERFVQELEISKKTIENLNNDQCQLIEKQDEMKKKLLDEIQEKQEKNEKLLAELAENKSKHLKMTKELENAQFISNELEEKLKKTEEKYEKANFELKNIEDQLDKLHEAELMNGSYEYKIDNLSQEHKNEIEQLRNELKKATTEHSSLEAVIEEQQNELIKHREETDGLQDQLRINQKQNEDLKIEIENLKSKIDNQKEKELEQKLEEVKKTNEELIGNFEEINKLLEIESKRLDQVKSEKKQLENEIETLKTTKNVSNQNEEKINELINENARLAGELLKSHSISEKSLQTEREKVAKQFEDRLKNVNYEKTRLASELQIAQSKIEEQQILIENCEKRRQIDIQQLEKMREEFYQIKNDHEKNQSNGPIAPPRSTRTISNMSSMTNWTQADFSDCEDLTKLRAEIDKQKRLIVVLRRKLQSIKQ